MDEPPPEVPVTKSGAGLGGAGGKPVEPKVPGPPVGRLN